MRQLVFSAFAVLVLAVAGCDVDDDTTDVDEAAEAEAPEPETEEPATEEPESPEPEPDEPAAEDEEPDSEPDAASEQFVREFDDPVEWSDDGLELTIHGVGINDLAWVVQEESDLGMVLDEEDGETVLVLDVEASNNTGAVISWYPDQGEIVLDDEQTEPDLFLSGDVGHTDWEDGTTRHDEIVWVLRTPFDEAVEAGELRYLVSAAHDAEDFMADYGSDADITVEWEQ